jgi:hypothetical protein
VPAPSAPTVFLSHSHADKRIARRLVRSLSARGIKVWIDERELRAGAALTASLRAQIEAADTLLVVASKASAASRWVGLELDCAREHDKTIIPFLVEPVAEHPRFADALGLDATAPQALADVVHRLMRDLFLSLDLPLPPADPAALTAGLRALAAEEPNLAPLIHGCLDSEGLHRENIDTVADVPFQALDEALNALYELNPGTAMADHAAYGFCRSGAGTRALACWIEATGDGALTLATAVGSRRLEAGLIPTAIKLLAACSPPNNHALYSFIDRNAVQLDAAQRRSVIRLVTWPLRADTEHAADVLGWVALRQFPDAGEIQQMWARWIEAGVFDGRRSSPMDLARYLADAHKEGLSGWQPASEALRSHVRHGLRSGDEAKVRMATNHLRAAADAGAPVLAALLTEAQHAMGSAEWNDWRKRDDDDAERMRRFVSEVVKEATGEQDWLRAWDAAKENAAPPKQRPRIRDKRKRGRDGAA